MSVGGVKCPTFNRQRAAGLTTLFWAAARQTCGWIRVQSSRVKPNQWLPQAPAAGSMRAMGAIAPAQPKTCGGDAIILAPSGVLSAIFLQSVLFSILTQTFCFIKF